MPEMTRSAPVTASTNVITFVMPSSDFAIGSGCGATYFSFVLIFALAKLPRTVKTIVLPSYSSEASSASASAAMSMRSISEESFAAGTSPDLSVPSTSQWTRSSSQAAVEGRSLPFRCPSSPTLYSPATSPVVQDVSLNERLPSVTSSNDQSVMSMSISLRRRARIITPFTSGS